MLHKALNNLKPSYGGFSNTLGAETNDKIETATFVDMRDYDLVIAYAQASNVNSDGVVTLTLLQATSTAGAGSATTTFTDTFTSTATTDTDVLQAEMRGEQLSSGYRYAGARLAVSSGGDAERVSLILVQGRPRYGQHSLP